MTVTLKDIADKVGKSITTVSRALDDYDDVSPKTKALVRQAAEEMGFTPNIVAQRLQKQRTDTLGFIIPTFGPRFSDPFFSEFLAGIGNKAASFGYDLLVSTRPPGNEEMQSYREIVQGKRVDGFILLRTRQQDSRIAYLLESGFPFVAFGRTRDGLSFPFVDEDSELGMRLVLAHLTGLGHLRIACLAPPQDLTFAYHRVNGFREGMAQASLPVDESLIVTSDLTQRGGYEQAKILLSRAERPTAIVSCNDLMAFGAIRAAQELGLVVGKDLAITGFDDIPMSEHSNPPLTTVNQPIYKIGTMVCDMLIHLIRHEPVEEPQILLRPELMVRQSSFTQE
ncbi:MAG: LacI family DNA-binding transcriptional regulator [Anaerolineales bacterium]|nr:LacI family DNA-binding transcriptional regulator [Anaerolineales bacterium]